VKREIARKQVEEKKTGKEDKGESEKR